MRNTIVAAVIAVASLLVAACSSADPAVANNNHTSASAVRFQVPFPSPLPTIPHAPCSVVSDPCLAAVSLRGGGDVIRDITDISHPKTVGAPRGMLRFISATEQSFIEVCVAFRTGLSGSPRSEVVSRPSGTCVAALAWSPDGRDFAYLGVNRQQNTEVHIVRGGSDHLAATSSRLPPNSMFGNSPCETQTCADASDFQFTYSPDGALVMWAQDLTSTFRIWTRDGLEVTPSVGRTFMPIWSGSSLFFQDSKGIEVFRNGKVSLFLPNATWIRPKASPTGGQIVYEWRDTVGLAHTSMVDTTSAAVRQFGVGRGEPAFLTSRYLWYQGERLCVGVKRCDLGVVKPTGKTFIYDLQDGTEADSVITAVYDVWPHAA